MIFITFEGIEKVGKTTNITFANNFLTKKGHRVTLTREPGGTILGESVRNIILNASKKEKVNYVSELFLLFAARYQHIDKVILPSIMNKKIILCDRFIDSSYAYQAGGRKISLKKIRIVDNLFYYNIKPDYVFLLNYPIKESLKKIRSNNHADRIEKEKIDFFFKVKKI